MQRGAKPSMHVLSKSVLLALRRFLSTDGQKRRVKSESPSSKSKEPEIVNVFFGFGVTEDRCKINGFQVVHAVQAKSCLCEGLAFGIKIRRTAARGGQFGTWRPAAGSSQGSSGGHLQSLVDCAGANFLRLESIYNI